MIAGPRRRSFPGKLTAVTFTLAFIAGHHMYRQVVRGPAFTAPKPIQRLCPSLCQTADRRRPRMRRLCAGCPPAAPPPPAPPPVRVYVQPLRNGWRSLGEVIRVHQPLALAPARRHPGKNKGNIWCADFSGAHPVSTASCATLLAKQSWENTGASYDDVRARTNPAPPQRCAPGTTVVVALSWRDYNVCHIMMRLLLAHTVTQRARHTPHWLRVPAVRRVVVLAGSDQNLRHLTSPARFHAGFVHALFTNHGVQVVIVRTLDEVAKNYPCYATAVFVGSHSNRFAFPDTVLGANAGYDRARPGANMTSRPHPISSDALALRAHVFGPRAKKMRFKLLYVYRGGGARRRWSKTGERNMDKLLRRVTRETGAEFVTFKPSRGETFHTQVAHFEDACVIVGLHGAGLALSVFAPRSAALVEIEPVYHFLPLFRSVRSSGIAYDMIQLSNGTMNEFMYSSDLIPKDERRIATLLRTRLRERKRMLQAKS